MELRSFVFVFLRSSAVFLLFSSSCDGSPVSIYDNDFDDFKRDKVEENQGSNFLVVALMVSAVVAASVTVFAVFCMWCRLGSKITRTSNHNGVPSVVLNNEADINDRVPSTEFTIFPPDSGRHLVDQLGSENVKFEPLPDIRPRRQTGDTNLLKPKPAPYNNVVSKGLSFQDWFEDPYSNFPRTQLQYVRELGSGWFGQVVEGEACGIVPKEKKSKVVVKILMGAANTTDQMYFLHEVKPFRDVNHPNVLRLLGKCLDNDPYLIILEHCAFKDLKSYLIQHRTESESFLQQNLLLRMACNVAAGLQYLHKHGFILTDLAARNCLVTSDLTVKVGDYGNGIELFKDDYYCAGGIAVPVRWCAPETLRCTETIMETKEVTQDANIWSFGVVLWEVLEFGKVPYMELSDDEFIQKVIIERSEHLRKPLMPCSHLDRLFQIIQLSQLSQNCRPSMDRIHAMLNHLNSNPDGGRDSSSDFEVRWNDLNPRRSPSKSASSSVEWQSVEFDRTSRDRLFSSPHPSLSCDSDFQQSITSPSLQNLRGSFDDLGSSASAVDLLSSDQLLDLRPSIDRQFAISNIDYAGFLSSSLAAQQLLSDGDRSSEKEVSPFTREVNEVFRKLDEDLDKEYQTSGAFTDVERDLSEDTKNDCSLLSDDQYVPSTSSEVGLESMGEIFNACPISIRNVQTEAGGEDGEGGGRKSSLSDEEDASWKKIVESSHEDSGEITRIIREKSQSVQDFLKLTVIDSESGSDSDGVPHGNGGGGASDSLVSCAGEQECQQQDEEEQLQVRGITYLGESDVNGTSGGDGIVCVPSGVGLVVAAVSSSHATDVTDCSSITTTTTIYPSDAHALLALENLAWNVVRSAADDALQDAATLCVGASVTNLLQHRDTNGFCAALGNIGCSEINACALISETFDEPCTENVKVLIPDIVVEEAPSDPPQDDDNAVEETVTYVPKSNLNFRFKFKNLNGGYDDYFSEEQSSVEEGSGLEKNGVDVCALSVELDGVHSDFSTTPKSVNQTASRPRTSTPRANGDEVYVDVSLRDDVFCNLQQDTAQSSILTASVDSRNDVFDDVSLLELVHVTEAEVLASIRPVATVNEDRDPADELEISSRRIDPIDNARSVLRDADAVTNEASGLFSGFHYEEKTCDVFTDETAARGGLTDKNIPRDYNRSALSDVESFVSMPLSNNYAHEDVNVDVLSSDEGFEASEPSSVDHADLCIDAPNSIEPGSRVLIRESDEEEEILLVDLETNQAVLLDGIRPKSRLSFTRDKLEDVVDFVEDAKCDIDAEHGSLAAALVVVGGKINGLKEGSSSRSSLEDFYEEGTKDSTDVSSTPSPECGSKRGSDSSNYSQSTEDEFDFMKSDSKPVNDETSSANLDDELTTVQLRRTSTREQRDNHTRFEVHKIPEDTLNFLAQLSSPTTNDSDSQFSFGSKSNISTTMVETSNTVATPLAVVVASSESNKVENIKVEELRLCKSSAPTAVACYAASPVGETSTDSTLFDLLPPHLDSLGSATIATAALDTVTSPLTSLVMVTASEPGHTKNIKVEELRLCKFSSPLLDVDTATKESDATSPAWESGTDSSSSSCLSPSSSSTSGEFDCSKSIGYNVYMEERDPDAWNNEEDSNADDEMDENEDKQELKPFQISTWNKNLTPTKGLLRSPEKRLQADGKKAVTFKFSKRSVIYEYPKEEVEEVDEDENVEELDDDGRQLWSFQVYGSGMDYSNYADWELANEEIPDDIVEVEGFDDGSDNSDDFMSPAAHYHRHHHNSSSGAQQLYKLSNIGDEELGSDYASESGVATSYYAHPDSFDFATYLAHYNVENPYNNTSVGNQSADEDFWLETILNTSDFFANGSEGPLEFNVDSLDPNGLPQWALNPATINMYVGGDDDPHRYDGYEDEHDTDEEDDEGAVNDIRLIDFGTNFEVDSSAVSPAEDLAALNAEEVPWDEVDSGESVESDPNVAMETDSTDNNLDSVMHLANGVSNDVFLNGNELSSTLNNVSEGKLSETTIKSGVVGQDSDIDWWTPVCKLTDSNAINCNAAAVVSVENGTVVRSTVG